MSLTHKSLAFELKKEPDADGVFEGYASVFDVVDNGMDVVARGAFRKSIAERKPKMLWQHDTTELIGVWDEVEEDDRGLFVKGRLLKDVQKGREAMTLMRHGAIDSMSIGYRTKEAVSEGEGRVRRLTEVELFEVSLVTFPMNERATITAMKSLDWGNKRDVERSLRDVFDLTQAEAKAFIADGLKGLQVKRDVDAGGVEPLDMSGIKRQLKQLQENLENG